MCLLQNESSHNMSYGQNSDKIYYFTRWVATIFERSMALNDNADILRVHKDVLIEL